MRPDRGPLGKSISANAFGLIVTVGVQVVMTPIFLVTVGVAEYGAWLVLIAVPSALLFADLGSATAASTAATALVARGELDAAKRTLSSLWAVITVISGGVALVAAIVLPQVAPQSVRAIVGARTVSVVIVSQLLTAFAWLQAGFIEAAFRADRQYARGVVYHELMRLSDLVITAVALVATHSLLIVAISNTTLRTAMTIIYYSRARARITWFRLTPRGFDLQMTKRLASPSITYMGFPIGHAITGQGLVVLVGATRGPGAVVLLTAVRTLANVLRQVTSVLRRSATPEITFAVNAGEVERAKRVFIVSSTVACAGASAACAILLVFGRFIVAHWTANRVVPSEAFLVLMLLSVLADVPWETAAVLPVALNRHQLIGAAYVFAGLAALATAHFLMPRWGLNAVPVALLILDVILTPVALRSARRVWQLWPVSR